MNPNIAITVLDVGAPSSQRAILELEKPRARHRLHWIALAQTTSDAAAEDLVEDALVRVLVTWPSS